VLLTNIADPVFIDIKSGGLKFTGFFLSDKKFFLLASVLFLSL